MTVSLLTHGWICHGTNSILNRYVLPLPLDIKDKSFIDLFIKNKLEVSINANNIIDKNVNLKITEEQINIKDNNDDEQINIQ